MKTLFTFAVLALTICVVGNPKHAAAQWPQATSHEPTITTEIGVIAFDREGLSDSPLSITDTVTNTVFLSSEQASDLGSAAGVQGKIIFPSRRTQQTFELRGLYTGWDEVNTVTGDNINSPFFVNGIFQIEDFNGFDLANDQLVAPLPIGVLQSDLALATIPLTTGFDGTVTTLSLVWPGLPGDIFADGVSPPSLSQIFDIDTVTTSYQSDFFSVELMSRRNTRPGVTWLFGPRFVSVREEASVTATGLSPTRIFFDQFNPPFTFVFDGDGDQVFIDATTGEVVDEDDDNAIPQIVFTDISGSEQATAATRAETQNSLIGLQIGLEYNVPVSQDIYFQISGRGGLFFNAARATRSLSPLRQASSNGFDSFTTRESDTSSGESFLAEFSARVYADLIPNSVSCYAGYDLLFIDQLAFAPNQSVATNGVDRTSDLFARGFTFGVKTNY